MKVAHLCYLPLFPGHPDYKRIRAHPGRWVLNLALAQRAHSAIHPELLVVVPGASQDCSTEIEGIPVHYVAVPRRARAATLFYFEARDLAARVRKMKPDLVHAHGTEDSYGLGAQRSGLPCVITAQGLHFLINPLSRPALVSRERIVEFTERMCLRRARHVIAKSAYVAEALHRQFPHLLLHRIPNTIDPGLIGIPREEGTRVIAFVGVITPRKGLDLIADAIAAVQVKYPDVQLWVFGDEPAAPSKYEAGLKKRLTAMMGERVRFHGTLPGIEVARRVAGANLLIAPSREEMFGNQLIESLVVGTHAIVTEQTALAENVGRFGNGTVVPQEDADAIALAVNKLFELPPARSEAIQARDRVIAEFGPEIVAAQHRSLYASIIAESPKVR